MWDATEIARFLAALEEIAKQQKVANLIAVGDIRRALDLLEEG